METTLETQSITSYRLLFRKREFTREFDDQWALFCLTTKMLTFFLSFYILSINICHNINSVNSSVPFKSIT